MAVALNTARANGERGAEMMRVPRSRLRPADPPARMALVVDDDGAIGKLLSFYLKEAGWAPMYAADGLQALSLAAQYPFAVVVLDVMLPDLSGWEICRELRRTSDVPILLLSGKDDEQDIAVGLAAGADAYMTKPFNGAEVIARLQQLAQRPEPLLRPLPPREVTLPGSAPDPGSPRRVGAQLRQARLEAGLSFAAAAARTGVPALEIQALEREHIGLVAPRQFMVALEHYARYFDVDPQPLLDVIRSGSADRRRQVPWTVILTVVLFVVMVMLVVAIMVVMTVNA